MGLKLERDYSVLEENCNTFTEMGNLDIGVPRKWEIHDIDADLNEKLLKDFRGERSGYLQVGEKKYFFPKKFADQSTYYKNFKPRSTDTWIISFPRSGTTWTQEMVWLLANNLDYESAGKLPLSERFPFFEYYSCVNNELIAELLTECRSDIKKKHGIEKVCNFAVTKLEEMKTPRYIKTHLPFSLLPDDLLKCGAKIVYVARNPKDVAVSFYHLHRLTRTLDFVGDFSKFWSYFEQNLVLWSPYWEHLREGWLIRNHPNVFFILYEDMRKDLYRSIKNLSKFLGKDYNDELLLNLSEHLHISNFRKNSAVNMEMLQDLGMLNDYPQRHIRAGKTGSWKEMFNDELNKRADNWVKENLINLNLKFSFA